MRRALSILLGLVVTSLSAALWAAAWVGVAALSLPFIFPPSTLPSALGHLLPIMTIPVLYLPFLGSYIAFRQSQDKLVEKITLAIGILLAASYAYLTMFVACPK